MITWCRQELSDIRIDDAQPSGVQQSLSSNVMRTQKRAAPSTDRERAGADVSTMHLQNFQNVLMQLPADVRA